MSQNYLHWPASQNTQPYEGRKEMVTSIAPIVAIIPVQRTKVVTLR